MPVQNKNYIGDLLLTDNKTFGEKNPNHFKLNALMHDTPADCKSLSCSLCVNPAPMLLLASKLCSAWICSLPVNKVYFKLSCPLLTHTTSPFTIRRVNFAVPSWLIPQAHSPYGGSTLRSPLSWLLPHAHALTIRRVNFAVHSWLLPQAHSP